MDQHCVPVVGRVCQQWSDRTGFALACPDQDGQDHEAPQDLQSVIQGPIGPKIVDGLQLEGELLHLAWQHRADCKDSTHAQRLAEIPDRQHLMTHPADLTHPSGSDSAR